MCCTRLAGNTEPKNGAKNRHLRTIAQLCQAIYLQLRHISTIGKKLVKQQYLLHMSSHGPLVAEIDPVIWGIPANFNGFCVLAALLRGTPVLSVSQKLCGVEQRAPAVFGRAAITLGIGPHSSFILYFQRAACNTFQTCFLKSH